MNIKLAVLKKLLNEWSEPDVQGVFHIKASQYNQDPKKEIVLQPFIPMNVRDRTDAEDFTTPRVCLATSVHDAVYGRFGQHHDSHLPQDEMWIYWSPRVQNVIVPTSRFDMHWNWTKYAHDNGIDPSNDDVHASLVKNCVPDAEKTGEVWSLTPVKMKLIGKLFEDKFGSGIKVEYFD